MKKSVKTVEIMARGGKSNNYVPRGRVSRDRRERGTPPDLEEEDSELEEVEYELSQSGQKLKQGLNFLFTLSFAKSVLLVWTGVFATLVQHRDIAARGLAHQPVINWGFLIVGINKGLSGWALITEWKRAVQNLETRRAAATDFVWSTWFNSDTQGLMEFSLVVMIMLFFLAIVMEMGLASYLHYKKQESPRGYFKQVL